LPNGAYLQASGGEWVFVLSEDARSAKRRSVKIGRRNVEQVEILSGLEPGERVITSDYTTYANIERIELAR